MTEMTVRRTAYEVTVPAGRYFLGDPCYAVPAADWDTLGRSTGWFFATPIGAVNGRSVVSFSTAHGDGRYRDNRGGHYGVDAGMIGLTQLFPDDDIGDFLHLGRVVTFDHSVIASTDGEGRLCFGEYEINTAWPEDETDYETLDTEEEDEEEEED